MEKIQLSEEEVREFKLEAQELLDACEASLLALEAGEELKNHYDAIFRAFHTIKGAAGMLALNELQAHVHELESRLMEVRELPSLEKEMLEYFLNGCDGTRNLLDGKPVSSKKVDSSTDEAPGEFYAECDELTLKIENFLKLSASMPGDEVLNQSLYREIHTLKGILQLYGLVSLGEVTHAMETYLESVKNGATLTEDKLRVLLEALDHVAAGISAHKEKKAYEADDVGKKLISELMEESMVKEVQPQIVQEPVVETEAAVADKRQQVGAEKQEGHNTIRVPVTLLDNLMRLMGEMVLVRNQVIQFSNKEDDLEFLNLSQRLDIVTSEIQGEVMKTRMQPIGNILSKFNRVVRDLAKELGKKIDFQLEGTETELDKSLLELIKDPLMHIVRNSCDHGIESPDIRIQSGKNEMGKIMIRSFHEGGQVVIEITDDGKGLDRDKIVAKALEKGLLTQERLSTLSDRDIQMLIFAPGFSTAAVVSNVSGRGVGMDVVKNNIEKMGGVIDLNSTKGKGTTLRLKIPLTLAIIPAMVVKSGEQRYAIPQVKLIELVRIEKNKSANQIEMLQGRPVLRLRGSLLPLIGLGQILGEGPSDFEADITNIVVLNADHQVFGLIVDEILDTADIVVKPLSRFLKALSFYSGATVLGDGSVSLILDVVGLLNEGFSSQITKEEGMSARGNDSKDDLKSETQEFLLFRLNNPTKFSLPLGLVHRLEEFPAERIEYSGSQKMVQYRDTLLPVISLNDYFKFGAREGAGSGVISVIVLKKGDRLYGFEVDEILDVMVTTTQFDDSSIDREGIMGNIVINKEMTVVIDTLNILDKAVARLSKENDTIPLKVEVKRAEGTSVLLVEDTAFFRKQITKVLVKHGFSVTTKENGEEALQYLEELEKSGKRVDLVLSDIEMPRMNGWDLARRLRAHSSLRSLPLIALTTRFSKDDVAKGMEAGFDIYLEKLNEELLIRNISKLLLQQEERKVS